MTLTESAKGRVVLLTGSTGFLGGVILEKLLWALPEIKKIVLIVREKKGEQNHERFIKMLNTKPSFERLRKKYGKDFENYIKSKVQLINGDLLQENLGLSKESEETIINEVNVFINCAAQVDFKAELVQNIKINLEGTLKLFQLAKKTKNLTNFLQVSTCYVNSDKVGFIKEIIYEYHDNPEETIDNIMKMSPDTVKEETKKILGQFKNSYVYSKNYCERILEKQRPKGFTLTIVRPSILGCAYKDPMPGWTENVTAGNAFYLFVGIGTIRFVQSPGDNIGGIIPVDCCADQIIASAFLLQNTDQVHVINSCTSDRNPFTWKFSEPIINKYFRQNQPEKKFSKPQAYFIQNKALFNIFNYMRELPAQAYLQIGNLTNNKKMKMDGTRWVKMIEKGKELTEIFSHFTQNEFIFESKKVDQLMQMMSEEEKRIFTVDVAVFSMYEYFLTYAWGLHKYILNESVEPPTTSDMLIKQPTGFFSDIQWAMTSGKYFSTKSPKEYQNSVINSERVRAAMKKELEKRVKKYQQVHNKINTIEEQKIKDDIQKRVVEMADIMIADYKMPLLRIFAWFFHKMFNMIYDKVIVDKEILQKLQDHNVEKDGPLIIIPTHRSYIDFLIMSYIFFAYRIQSPHIAAADLFRNIAIVGHFMRYAGAFFIEREASDPLYKSILYEYTIQLLENNCFLEFFIEGTRSRSFRMLPPKFGILSKIVQAVEQGRLQNATILSVGITYEKVLEGESYPYELMGEEKVKESLGRLIKAAKTLTQNFGRVNVAIAAPINLKAYIQKWKSEDFRTMCGYLGYEILHLMQEKISIMPTYLVAAIVLMNRKGILEYNLLNKFQWLQDECIKRGALIGYSQQYADSSIILRNSIKLLEKDLQISRKTVFEMHIRPKAGFFNVLMLNYYRNGLIHLFIQEGFMSCALCSFGYKAATEEGVPLDKHWQATEFLKHLLKLEHISRFKLKTYQKYEKLVEKMNNFGVITSENGLVKIKDINMITFLNNLIWPIVECYWITLLYLLTLKSNNQFKTTLTVAYKIQWFAEDLFNERIIEHHEACSLDMINDALQMYMSLKFIEVKKAILSKNERENETVIITTDINQLKAFQEKLSSYLKSTFIQNPGTAFDIAKRTVLGELLYTPKL